MIQTGAYNAAYHYYDAVQQKYRKGTEKNTEKTETGKTQNTDKTNQGQKTQLSEKAQALLKKLKEKYRDMDIIAADYSTDEEAQSILSRGTKEFSVLISSDELEKMAEDEDYEKECMSKVEEAVEQSKQFVKEYNANGAPQGEITKIGISIGSDGTLSYFAELEKSSAQQKERIEKTREKNAEEKKAAEKKAQKQEQTEKLEKARQQQTSVKKTTVEAESLKELLSNIEGIDWSKVTMERKETGNKVDFSV